MIGKRSIRLVCMVMNAVIICIGGCIDDPGHGIHGSDGEAYSYSPFGAVREMVQDSDGVFYGITYEGVLRFTKEGFISGDTTMVYRNVQLMKRCLMAAVDNNNRLVIASYGCILRLDPDGTLMKDTTLYRCEDASAICEIVAQEPNGAIWFATEEHIVLRWNGHEMKKVARQKDSGYSKLLFAEADDSGAILFAAEGDELSIYHCDMVNEPDLLDSTMLKHQIHIGKETCSDTSEQVFVQDVFCCNGTYVVTGMQSCSRRTGLDTLLRNDSLFVEMIRLPGAQRATFQHQKRLYVVCNTQLLTYEKSTVGSSMVRNPYDGTFAIDTKAGLCFYYFPTLRIFPLDSL